MCEEDVSLTAHAAGIQKLLAFSESEKNLFLPFMKVSLYCG